jgi:hypothetical protein
VNYLYIADGNTSCGVSLGITVAKICNDLNAGDIPLHSSVHPKPLLQFLIIKATS